MNRRMVWGALAVMIALVLPVIMPNSYWVQVLVTAVIYTIAAMGLNFIYGFTGYISFAQAAFLGIGSYTTALLSVDHGWHPILTWAAVIVVSGLFGVLLGIPSLKLKGHYLAMATIGFTFVLQMLLQNWTGFTHGAQGINNIPTVSIGSWQADSPTSFYYVAFVMLCLLWLFQRNILRSRLGRSLLAIREDEIAAGSAGINLTQTKVLAFVISGIYGGLAGSLYAQFSNYISPDTYSFDQSVVFFTMTLVGGAGTLAGPIVGGVLLTLLPEFLRFIKDYYMAIYGLGIFFVVLFMPRGIVPVVVSRFGKRRTQADSGTGVGTSGEEEVVA